MSRGKKVRVDPREPSNDSLGRTKVGGEIGRGGMSVIREALDTNLLRTAAIKMIHPDISLDVNTRRRMIEEAQITAQLDHPNILPVHELGVMDDGRLFFTMKAVEGRTLTEILDVQDPATRTDKQLMDLLQSFLRVCDAVAFAHSLSVIHRDLKPDNIMVGDFGEVYLMDWGISRLKNRDQVEPVDSEDRRYRYQSTTEKGKYLGTPHYMSPEQATGDHNATDERSDIFSLGAILYEILTKRPPYQARHTMEVLVMSAERDLRPPTEVVSFNLPPRLCSIAMKAMAKRPEERYQSVLEFKQDLEGFLDSGWQFQMQMFQPGDEIVREGEVGEEAYIITGGRCRVFKVVDHKQMELTQIGAGDVFGETAVFSDEPRNATVQAMDRVTVRVVPREFFAGDMGMGMWMGLFVKALAHRFNERNSRATELEHQQEDTQLALQILKYLNFSGEDRPDGRREARWSPLREAMATQFNRTQEQITAAVLGRHIFTIHDDRDAISIGKL